MCRLTADDYVPIWAYPQGHAGECYGLAVGAGGLHAVSCGSDRALRLYTRTEEPLVLGDEDEEQEGLATGETHVSLI